jgi:hypothetical protein
MCGKEGCTYLEQRKKVVSSNRAESLLKEQRKNFKARCKFCKWEGEI